jgi:hypothetical protein
MFLLCCPQWICGENSQLRRAGTQALGLLAEAEGGARFAKRLTSTISAAGGGAGAVGQGLLPPLRAALLRQAALTTLNDSASVVAAGGSAGVEGGEGVEDEGITTGACPGWHEAYFGLVLLEKVRNWRTTLFLQHLVSSAPQSCRNT